MANNIIDIIVNAQDQASSVIRGVTGSFDSLGASAKVAGGVALGALGAMGAGMAVVAGVGVKYNAMLESSDARWQTLTGSVEGANRQMDFISQYAKSSPFDYQGIDETATSLMGMGMELSNVNDWIPTLGDFASVMGGGTETIKGVGVALGQMSAKGKVSAEEMAQLSERGFNGWQAIADGMGLSVAEVRKLSEEGKLLASDALPMLQAGMEKTFGGGTAKYMASTAGQFDQLKEGASEFAGILTKGAFDAFGATVLPAMNSGLTTLSGVFSGGLLSGFQMLATESTKGQVAIALVAGALTTLLIPAIISLVSSLAPIVVAFAPFIAIGAVVAGLAFIIMKNWGTIAPFFAGIFNVIKPAFEAFKTSAVNSFNQLKAGIAPVMAQLKTTFETFKPILTAVGVLFGAVLGNMLVVGMATFNGIVSAIAPVITAFLALVDFVGNVIMTIVNLLTGNWSGALASWNSATQSAVTFFKSIWQAVVAFFTGFISTVVGILGSFGINIKSIFANAMSSISSAVASGVAKVVSFFSSMRATASALVSALGSSIKSGFSSAMSSASSAVSKGISNIVKFFTNMKTTATALVKALGSAITSGFSSAMSSARSAVSSGVSTITSLFTSLGSRVISTIKSIASNMVSSFSSMMSRARSAVSSGVSSIVGAVKGFAGTFLSAGKGLLDAFTKGIVSGISKAKSAVSSGMSAIRDFLPFSPAKKGALSDLDKSGKSFFPTWYEGALTQVRGMERAIGGAMYGLNSELASGYGEVGLQSFNGGRKTQIIKVQVEGAVNVKGDTGKEQVKFVGEQVSRQVSNGLDFNDLRMEARKF